MLGSLRPIADGWEFDSTQIPGLPGSDDFGVRIRGTNSIPASDLLGNLGGTAVGPYNVSGDAFARFPASGSGEPQLVRVISILP